MITGVNAFLFVLLIPLLAVTLSLVAYFLLVLTQDVIGMFFG